MLNVTNRNEQPLFSVEPISNQIFFFGFGYSPGTFAQVNVANTFTAAQTFTQIRFLTHSTGSLGSANGNCVEFFDKDGNSLGFAFLGSID